MWKLKDSIKDHIYETDSQTQRTGLWLPRGRGVKEGSTGSLGLADANYDVCVCYVPSRSVMSDCGITESSVHGDSPGKNTGAGCHDLLQGIFPTQGLDPGLLHCRRIIYHLSHQGSPTMTHRMDKQ